MKTSYLPQPFIGRSCLIGALVCLTFLLASVRPVQARVLATFAQAAGTNVYNVYAFDPNTGDIDGTAPASGTLAGLSIDPAAPAFSGTPLPYFQFLPAGVPIINGVNAPAAYTGPISSVTFPAAGNPTLSGAVLSLDAAGAAAEEFRFFDWMATYTCTGTGQLPNLIVSVSGASTYLLMRWQERRRSTTRRRACVFDGP